MQETIGHGPSVINAHDDSPKLDERRRGTKYGHEVGVVHFDVFEYESMQHAS